MKKNINIKLYKNNKLINEYKNINSLYNENISFKIDNIHTKITKDSLIRETEEYLFNIDLIKKESYIYLKDKELQYDIKVFNSNITREKNIVIIEYTIETEEEPLKIIIESE